MFQVNKPLCIVNGIFSGACVDNGIVGAFAFFFTAEGDKTGDDKNGVTKSSHGFLDLALFDSINLVKVGIGLLFQLL